MATIGSLALAIRAKTESLKGDLKPALEAIKQWGEAAKAAGADAKEVERAMARMRAEALSQKNLGEGAKSFGDHLRNAKVAASALTGAISAVSSEMGGAVGHATRLGTSLIQSFLAGGPIAAGVTALAAGISAVAGASADAAAEIKRVREEGVKFAADAKKTVERIEEEITARQIRAAERRGDVPKGFSDESAVARAFNKLKRDTNESIDWERNKIKGWVAEREMLLRQSEMGMGGGKDEIDKRTEWIRASLKKIEKDERELEAERRNAIDKRKDMSAAANEAIKKEQDDADKKLIQSKADDYTKRLTARVKELGTEFERASKASGEMARNIEGAHDALGKDAADRAKRIHEEIEAKAAASVGKVQKLAQGLNKGAEAGPKMLEDQGKFAQGLKDELELLRAANDFERERIQIQRQLEEQLKQGAEIEGAAATAKAIAAEKMLDVAMRETKAAQDKAAAEREASLEKAKQMEMARQELDITKKFANFGGAAGGTFGFGKGTAGFGWSPEGSNVRRRPAGPKAGGQGAGKGAAAGVLGDLKDLAPEVEAMQAELAKIPPLYERLAKAATAAAAATKQDLVSMGKTAAKAVGQLADTTRAQAAEIRAIKQELARQGGSSGLTD